MKSEIFNSAIKSRKKLKFIYHLDQIELEPYYLSYNRNGKKVIYGRVNNTSNIQMSFNCQPLSLPDYSKQSVTIYLNGRFIEKVTLQPHRERYSVILIKEKLLDGFNTIEFGYAFAHRPKDVMQGSTDTRSLAVLWYSIVFNETPK